MPAALVAHDAWVCVRNEVCKRFLEQLCKTVEDRLREEMPDLDPDFDVQCHFEGDKRNSNCLWITRKGWIRYGDVPPDSEGRSAIRLEAAGRGPYNWFCGVRSPKSTGDMTKKEKQRREELRESLGKHGLLLGKENDGRWLQWKSVPSYPDWNAIVPGLHKECEARGGPITTYYADTLLEIAARVIPAIDEVEGPESNPEH